MVRVFPHASTSPASSQWLLENYGVTADDVERWRAVIDAKPDPAMKAFLSDQEALLHFLERLLKKYQSSGLVHATDEKRPREHVERKLQSDRRKKRERRAKAATVCVRLLDATVLVHGKPVKLSPT